MTESDWLAATDPAPMLEFLRGKVSDRKLRLFGVACSRRAWGRLDDLGRAAVEVAEAYADGEASPDALRAARLACKSAGGGAAWYAAASDPVVAARNAALSGQAGTDGEAERVAQAGLLRDIFGNPFRPVAFDPAWLTPTVVSLAQTIYEERAFDRMTILADALAEAGCTNDDVLGHCRGAGPHSKGCHVVDLALGRS